jgi:hypothetical protein
VAFFLNELKIENEENIQINQTLAFAIWNSASFIAMQYHH